jgi:hypothetical protein
MSASEGTNMSSYEALKGHEATDLDSWYDGFHFLELGSQDVNEFRIMLDEDQTETEWATSMVRRSNLDCFLDEFEKWDDLSESFIYELRTSRTILKTKSLRTLRESYDHWKTPSIPWSMYSKRFCGSQGNNSQSLHGQSKKSMPETPPKSEHGQ